jgi:transcriptional regulator with XRE-family HTH domain
METQNKEQLLKTAIGNIRKFRELKEITREQMAADLGLSVSGYSKLERGEIDLTLSRLHEISTILEIGISQILNFSTQNIFHINNSQGVHGEDHGGHYYFQQRDEYREKYIALLEKEIEELRGKSK